MIVVDTNVIAYLFIPGDHSAAARAAFHRDPRWSSPRLWRSELRNVLARYVRTQALSLEQAVDVQSAAEDLMAGNEHDVDSLDVLALAERTGRSAYDCEFVALASALGVPLVSSDTRLLDSFPGVAVSLAAFAAG